ncbi:YolD-like family protein [Staphylococcus epidermidis]|nr:YolD-like family protein [Staphylococcus epidermidis]
MKWQPFATIPEQYQQLEQLMKDQNKTDCPNLFEDQLQLLNKYTKISYEEIYDDRFFHSYFL